MKLLQDIKQCRTTFDTSDTRRSFGPIVVDYTKVQSKVSLKYDSWHKDVLSKFGQLLGQEMTQFHAQVSWFAFVCLYICLKQMTFLFQVMYFHIIIIRFYLKLLV